MKTILHVLVTSAIFIFSMLITPAEASAAIKTGNLTIGSGNNQLDLAITIDDVAGTVSFVMTGPSAGWFGFGFNTTFMQTGAYAILANVGGQTPKEYNIVFHTTPTLQSTQNLTNMNTSIVGARKMYTFTRALNTGDANDMVFSTALSSINLIWAFGTSTTLAYHSGNKGTASISLADPCANIPVTSLPGIVICDGDSSLIFGQYTNIAGTYYDTLQTPLGCDSVISQVLTVNMPQTIHLPPVSICEGDSALIFGAFEHIAGTYSITGTGADGCDSTTSVELIVGNADTSVIATTTQLTAVSAGAMYEWIDCSTGNPVPGATGQSFQAPVSGNYALRITENGCTAVSSCYFVISVTGIDEIATMLSVYPNPASHTVRIDWTGVLHEPELTLVSSDGRIIHKEHISSGFTSLDVSGLPRGIYLILLRENSSAVTRRLVIE